MQWWGRSKRSLDITARIGLDQQTKAVLNATATGLSSRRMGKDSGSRKDVLYYKEEERQLKILGRPPLTHDVREGKDPFHSPFSFVCGRIIMQEKF